MAGRMNHVYGAVRDEATGEVSMQPLPWYEGPPPRNEAWYVTDNRRRREEGLEFSQSASFLFTQDELDILLKAEQARYDKLRAAAQARIDAGCAPDRVWQDFRADLVDTPGVRACAAENARQPVFDRFAELLV